jgi:hypothetical protein
MVFVYHIKMLFMSDVYRMVDDIKPDLRKRAGYDLAVSSMNIILLPGDKLYRKVNADNDRALGIRKSYFRTKVEQLINDPEIAAGVYLPENKAVYINSDLSPFTGYGTIIHELVHLGQDEKYPTVVRLSQNSQPGLNKKDRLLMHAFLEADAYDIMEQLLRSRGFNPADFYNELLELAPLNIMREIRNIFRRKDPVEKYTANWQRKNLSLADKVVVLQNPAKIAKFYDSHDKPDAVLAA